ncbi:MAG TPA: glycoside hydrolase family 25 protein [Pseudonocardia sp.]
MVTYGLDLSHYQTTSLDLSQCRREGVEFVFIKSTEGASFKDSAFPTRLQQARAAGLLVAAYHFVRASDPASTQVAHIATVVPRDVPIILDVETNSGAIGLTRDLVNRLRAAGYRVPLLYLPRWYWQQIGSPSLEGLPSLWSSRYPDNTRGTLTDEMADVPDSYWTGYGGLGVTVLQFTSSARVAGHEPLDANAYRGTRAQLAALLGGEEDGLPTPNDVWMAPCVGTGPDGKTESHPAVAWLTVMAFRIAAIERATAQLVGRDPVEIDEAAVAANLAPHLVDALNSRLFELGPDDLQKIATAVADEQARRQAA